MNAIKKVINLFIKDKRTTSIKKDEYNDELSQNLLSYFIELEHYNFISCDKQAISYESLKSYFHSEPELFDYDFIRKDGSIHENMKSFLYVKDGIAKGKSLKSKSTKLYYLPVVKEEVLRNFSNRQDKRAAFDDNINIPNSYLIYIQLDHMLKPIKESPLENYVVLSPVLKYFLREGKTLEELKKEIVSSILSIIDGENYSKLDSNLRLNSEPPNKNLEVGLKWIHVRFKNWAKLSQTLFGIISSYLPEEELKSIFRFSKEGSYEKHIQLSYSDNTAINSFYIKDLEMVKSNIKNGFKGNALRKYLDVSNWENIKKADQRIDFFSNNSISEVKKILKDIPLVKWPSKYPLGMMQQVALNLIVKKAKEEDGFIFSVNGPPGTGKTTLLKDVFANILFDKVNFLRKTPNIFSKVQIGENADDFYYSLHPSLKNYRILVASNNNAAVENISADLPKDKDLFNHNYKFFGYSNSQKSWGKISAAMGKKANLENYFNDINEHIKTLSTITNSSNEPIELLTKEIKQKILTAEYDETLNDIDNESWQLSLNPYVNIDGEGENYIHSERIRLFGSIMDNYLSFILLNYEMIEKNLEFAESYFLSRGKRKTSNLANNISPELKDDFIQSMFDTVFLLTPILSSTFASIAHFLRDIKAENIGWLFIDEAGQATPQSAIGAIWRSKNVIVVGDPLQIPPVVTLSDDQLKLVARDSAGITKEMDFFNILTRPEVSVQEFADLNNPYGGLLVDKNNNQKWLGSPLRVHRRCEHPMFDICNETTYQSKMLYGTKSRDKEILAAPSYCSQWITIGGKTAGSGDHYIKQQGEKAYEVAKEFLDEHPGKECFIISPFVSVVQQLRKFEKQNNRIKVGTVHTFQGKEAPLVIFVLGVDDQKKGPLNWASNTPNLLNVAVSRAQNHFVVIGNERTWGSLEYFSTAKKHLLKGN